MKKIIQFVLIDKKKPNQTFLIMRLMIYLLLVAMLPTFATGYSQSTVLKFTEEPRTLANVIETIESQTDFRIFYKTDQISPEREVDIKKTDPTVAEALKTSFEGSDISFTVLGKMIVLAPSEKITQAFRVSGTVTDANGATMPGVSVQIEGTTTGTITDVNGKYTLELPAENAVLIFTFIGYANQKIAVKGDATINVTMIMEAQNLEQIVVVGYGTIKKSDITGSVASVNINDYKLQPITNPTAILKGRVAGVSITQSSGNLGGDYKIRIRGANSLSLSNEPLFVIDGIQMALGLNQINTNDIQSMEILKDASATAIFGSRGANGVVLITTKSGSEGPAIVEYKSRYSFRKAKNNYELVDPVTYAEFVNSRATAGSPTPYPQDRIDELKANGGSDMYDAMLQDGLLRDHQISVRGGTKATKYFISAGSENEDGVVVGSEYSRKMLRSNISSQVSKNLLLGLNLTATQRKTHNSNSVYQELLFGNLWGTAEPIFNADGTYKIRDPYGANTNNPYMTVKEANSDVKATSGVVGGTLKWDIIPGLTFNSNVGLNYFASDQGYVNNEFMKYKTVNSGSGRYYNNSVFWQVSNILTYKKDINEIHSFTVMAGQEASKIEGTNFSATGTGLPYDAVGYDNLSLNAIQTINSSYSESALQSFFVRANYSLKDRYLATVTYRVDGSSKFAPENRYSNFPAVGLGWRLSEEDFIKNLDVFSNLKLRFSWGKTGNQGLNPYQTQGFLTQQNSSYGTGSMYPGYKPYGSSNADLIWETTTQTNLGLDFGFFKSRLSFSIDVYKKLTEDLLQQFSIPDYNGGGLVWKNLGEVENKGIELSLNAIAIADDNWKWDVDLTFSYEKNKLLDLGGAQIRRTGSLYYIEEQFFALVVGESLGTFYGYKRLGNWLSSEADEAAKFGAKPGDNKFEDFDKDGKISGADYQVIGNAVPTTRFGFNTNLSYKDFSLNALFEGVAGGKTYNMTRANGAVLTSLGQTITLVEGMDFWTPTNEGAAYANPYSNTYNAYPANSQWLESSNFLKLKNISLAYNLSKKIIRFADLQFFVSGQNLLVITNYTGSDPESSATGSRDADSGLDFGAFPVYKAVTIGLNATF